MKTFRTIACILMISFFLNFAWEFLQAPFYGSFKDSLEINYLRYLYAIIGDSIYTILIYFAISASRRNPEWLKDRSDKKDLFLSVAIGLLLAIFIEYKGVFILHKWDYSAYMPTAFGIGLIPLLQMMILPAMSFAITKKIQNP